MHVIKPTGISTERFFKLFPLTFFRLTVLFLLITRLFGIGIFNSPERNFPVRDRLALIRSSMLPTAMISPPPCPANGPTSTIQSAALIVSKSCSTTMTVLPKSLSLRRVLISFSLSFACKPIVGSSNTYITPTRPPPI